MIFLQRHLKFWILLKFILFCFVYVSVFNGITLALATPEFTMRITSPNVTSYVGDDGYVINGVMFVKNQDPNRSITLEFRDSISNGKDRQGITVSYSQNPVQLTPYQNQDVSFQITIPDGVCDDQYELILESVLIAFTNIDAPGGSTTFNSSIGDDFILDINSGVSCAGGNGGLVFHDLDGDAVYEPQSGETVVSFGTARIYNSSNNILAISNLSTTNGVLNLPSGSIASAQNFYLTVDTSLYSGALLNKTWYGNFFVNRAGNFANLANAFVYLNISNYSQMTANVDLRSRNADRAGSFGLGTMTIGPDDKDQIISPARWDTLVAGTDYQYADLDYDGRIDPDDKDHVISSLYWDFPI